MNPNDLFSDGNSALSTAREAVNLVNRFISKFGDIGARAMFPSLRIKTSESIMEIESGFEIESKFSNNDRMIKLDIPVPSRINVFGLSPYIPLPNATEVKGGTIYINKDLIEEYGNDIRIRTEYDVEDPEVLSGLVYTSSPKDEGSNLKTENDYELYWLQAELKTIKFLREIYSEVRVEDIEVKAEVAVKEHIKELFDEDFRFEMLMQTKFSSHDRNERSRAMYYRKHHVPNFRGDIFKVMNDLSEILQASHFRRFLSIQKGMFKLGRCERGLTIYDPMEPIYLPNSMNVYSLTDLTLEEPAKNDNLLYRKSQFQKRVKKLVTESGTY